MKKFTKFLSVALSIIILTVTTAFAANAENNSEYVYLGGQSFGVKFYSDGVMVINLESYFNGNEYVCPAKDCGLKINDVITKANGESIGSNEALQNILTNSEGKKVELTVKRNEDIIKKTVKPIKNTVGMYLIGAWVRDSCAGIGTVTYYDSDKNYFAALGHGICDCDTTALMPLSTGEVVKANISGITKSVAGKAGSLNGYFTDNKIGNLTQNSSIGVYGTTDEYFTLPQQKIELAQNNEINIGDAEVYTTINNSGVQSFDVKITRICNKNINSNENFVIKITDDRLKDSCGGIVQGMSGSPIVQNGKLVGAVTHVFVNKPDEGFGITAQNMADNYKN